ncbi:MAG: DUF4249 family protein [Bacteroidota bacterium]
MLLAASMLAASLLAACDNTIEPIVDGETYFVINGFLDANADTQFVRVSAALGDINDQTGRTEADVRTTGPQGETVWRDSLVVLDDGSAGTLFWAPFRPEAGSTYRLEVSGSAGASVAETTLPTQPPIGAEPPDSLEFINWVQDVYLEGIERLPAEAVVTYRTALVRQRDTTRFEDVLRYAGGTLDAGRWSLRIRLSSDLFRDRGQGTYLFEEAQLSVRLVSSDWNLNADRLNNVENGVGFLGSAATFTQTWRIPTDMLNTLGYLDEQPQEDD